MSLPQHSGTPSDYNQPQPGSGARQSNGLAVAALVLGIVAILLFWTVFGGILLGLLAVVLGIIGARRARGGRAPHRTISIVGAVLGALGLIGSVVIIAIGASILNSDEFKDFNDCIKHASSQSEKDQCSRDFKQDTDN